MKKKILSIALSLCMVLTMMPMATGVAWAATAPFEGVNFSYAYDVQRDPDYPTKDCPIKLSGPSNPIVIPDNRDDRGEPQGEWTLTKAGTYAYMLKSNKATSYLTGIVSNLSSQYSNVDMNTIIIHELKEKGKHIAYGVVVAYGTDESDKEYALFQGDTLSGSGAGYFLSMSVVSEERTVTASTIFTEDAQALGISLAPSDDFSFDTVNEGYNAEDIETVKKTVTITNTGSAATGALDVSLSGSHADKFKISLPEGTTGVNIAEVGGTATFSIYPIVGLSAGTYNAEVTVSGKDNQDMESQSFEVSFTVKAADDLTYGIELNQSGTYTFDAATAGYGAQEPLTVTVTNTGTGATGELTVELSGTNESSFMLSKTSIDSIAAGGNNSFTVVPNTGLAAGTYTATVTVSGSGSITAKSFDVSFTVNAPSNPGSYVPTIQKPTIIADEGAEGTLSFYGDKLTIKVADGYEITDVLVNGVSKGKITEITGLKTGDKVEVKTEKKQEEPKEPTKEEIVAALDSSKLVARSKFITLKNGKKAVRITWYDKNGNEGDFDGVEIYRSTQRYKGYGLKPFYSTKGGKTEGYYVNTRDLKEGTTYYYRVRGYVEIDGQKYYTDYSLKAIRTIK